MAAVSTPVGALVRRLAPAVIEILGANPSAMTLDGTRTYLVGSGKSRILIDTGSGLAAWKLALASVLEEERCEISKCLMTHHHADHVGGAGDVADLGSSVFHKLPSEAEDATMVWPEAAGELQPLRNGDEFAVDGACVQVLATPGHTADSVSFLASGSVLMGSGEGNDPCGGVAAFVGDCVLGKGTSVISDLASFESSLELLIAAKPDVLYCGHGPEISGTVVDQHGGTVSRALVTLQELLQHRKTRVEQIMGVLSATGAPDSGLTARQVAEAVYRDAGMHHVFENPALVRAAAHQTLVSLRYLEHRGRVVRGGLKAAESARAVDGACSATPSAAGELAAMQEGGVRAKDLAQAEEQMWCPI